MVAGEGGIMPSMGQNGEGQESFFGFLAGFVAILAISVGVTVFINSYTEARAEQAAAAAWAILGAE